MINLNEIKIEDILKKSDNLILIAIVLVGLIIVSRVNSANANSADLLLKKIDAQKQINTISSEINIVVGDYQGYKNEIFFDKDSAEIVNLINELARQFDLEIISLRPLYLKEAEVFSYLPLELQAKGDYYSLGQFLSQIESYAGFIDISKLKVVSLRFNRRTEASKEEILKITLSLNALILKELDISKDVLGRF